MTPDVPADIDEVLAAAGFRAERVTDLRGPSVLASALDGSGWLVELHVVPGALDDETRGRVAALRGLRHDHVARLLEVVALPGDRLGLFVEHHEGASVALLGRARGVLSEGEAVTVAVPVAQGLEALHAVGVAHGRVGPTTVVVRPDGRPVLVDLRTAVAGTGTAGGDVADLVGTVLAALPPRPGPGDLVGALVDLADGTADARRVVDRCFRASVPEPVTLPSDAELERARLAAAPAADRVAALRRPAARPAGTVPRGERRPAAGGPRERRAGGRTVLVGAAVAVGLAVLVGAGAVVAGRDVADARQPDEDGTVPVVGRHAVGPTGVPASPRPAGTRGPEVEPVDTSAHAATDAPTDAPGAPDVAAVRLTLRRAEVLAAADRAALGDVDVPGGPAALADAALLDRLAGDRLDGLTVRVDGTRVLSTTGTESRVSLTSTTSAYRRVDAAGGVRTGGPAVTSTVVLVLRPTDAGWRVWDVLEG